MNGCFFCDRRQGQAPIIGGAIYEDDLVYACHVQEGDEPTYLGNLTIETKRHTPDFGEVTDAEAQAIGLLTARLSRALKACCGAERVYAYTFGEAVPHFHLFITARYPGTPPDYWRLGVTQWPDAPRGVPAEVAALCERLRQSLSEMSETPSAGPA